MRGASSEGFTSKGAFRTIRPLILVYSVVILCLGLPLLQCDRTQAIDFDLVATLPLQGFPLVSDLDEDGNKEISGMHFESPFDVRLHERIGDNSFAFAYNLPASIPWDSGDSDDDGLPEMLCQKGSEMLLYEIIDRFSFQSRLVWSTNITTPTYSHGKMVDLDKDGKTDLVFKDGASLAIWENVGNDAFVLAQKVNLVNGDLGDFIVGDFDGDNRTDIVIGNTVGEVFVIENSADNSYAVVWNHTLPLSHAYSFAGGDLDYDGKGDFVVTTHFIAASYNLTMFEYAGDNIYTEVWSKDMPLVGGAHCSLKTGDVDGDGLMEFVYSNANDVYVLERVDDNDFQVIWNAASSLSNTILVEDSDGDGLTEIILKVGAETVGVYELAGGPKPIDIWIAEWHIAFNPTDRVAVGQSVRIQALVHNIGTADAVNVSVRFFEGNVSSGTPIGSDYVIPLIPPIGGSVLAEVEWNSSALGSYQICVFADPEENVSESNESNNVACQFLDVVPTPNPPGDLSAVLSGWRSQNITLSWTLSSDDGAGNKTVVRYDIHRSEAYSATAEGYQILVSFPNGTSSHVDALVGEGNPKDYFYCICAVDAFNVSTCGNQQAAKFTRPLAPGPNLVSIPLIQSNVSIETVLQTVEYDKAWYYDSSSQEWKWHMTFKDYRRGMWSVNHTVGIWVNVSEDCNLTVAGIVPAQTVIRLAAGWNLVSFPSFNTTYTVADLKAEIGATRVEGYDIAPPYYLGLLGDAEVLQAGYGYWVKTEAETDWMVEVS